MTMDKVNDIPSVLLSIDPYYSHKILIREKLIEVRKNKPNIDTPFKCYIYCTKGKLALLRDDKDESERYKFEHYPLVNFHVQCGRTLLNGKVIGEFVCDKITTYPYEQLNDGEHIMPFGDLEKTCLDGFEIYNYLGNKDGYGWHITDLVIYDEPKELHEFKKNKHKCWYADLGIAKRDCKECKNADCFFTRPPQSWCYVEEAV